MREPSDAAGAIGSHWVAGNGNIQYPEIASRMIGEFGLIEKGQSGRRAYIHYITIYIDGMDEVGGKAIGHRIIGDRMWSSRQIDFGNAFIGAYPKYLIFEETGLADITA